MNPGSLGQPRDNDPRASYIIIENNQVNLKRFSYNIGKYEDKIKEVSLPLSLSERLYKGE